MSQPHQTADITQAVLGRLAADADPRFKQIISTVVKHAHAAIRELDLKPEEWMAAIQFLTKVGHTCDEKRQEFILLSDTLGTVDAYTGAQEGTVYALSVLPYMSETLGDAGFVADDYMAAWAAYADAVLAEDVDAATAASEQLVMWNCAMQAELGIAECTSDVDEM